MFIWVVDAVLDFYFFYEGTFWKLFIYDMPKQKVYIWSVIIAKRHIPTRLLRIQENSDANQGVKR